ncbi:putative carbamoyltransferase YgeW [bioreactor metagenome]|uniref:Putative carbamoyltransferase YgeW n=1 Tax=bioreactor metagenome TaxID=1076179 RepID=A0A644VUN8_9ZZZZ|nr:knotted carbamoyltransferase YgeW [Lentimicrobium sp.]MEA5110226.1 knotted carbamoyltransferase YgeW [Lentimicrobium sp.]
MKSFQQLTNELNSLKTGLFGRDFLLTWDKTEDDLRQTLLVADELKYLRDRNISTRCFDSGLAVSNFRDNSTRTRFSFASACNLLGLEVQDLDEAKSQIAHGETVRETANMISFLTDIIGIRDDMFLGEGHRYMLEMGAALDDGFSNGVLPQRPGIINLQCDIDHPTQSMADLLHLVNFYGGLDKLKGKKIAMTWAYSPSYGKPLSVPQGIIGLMTRFGMEVDLAFPEGYNLIPEVVEMAGRQAEASGGSFRVVNTMEEAFRDADIVYPKSWAPFAVMEQRTGLLKTGDKEGLKELEQQCLANNARYTDWECDEGMMKLTRNGNALYMHCLPADISGVSCVRGEVSAAVFERYRIQTYKEAGFKPYIIAAMILNNRFEPAAEILEGLYREGRKRVKRF